MENLQKKNKKNPKKMWLKIEPLLSCNPNNRSPEAFCLTDLCVSKDCVQRKGNFYDPMVNKQMIENKIHIRRK